MAGIHKATILLGWPQSHKKHHLGCFIWLVTKDYLQEPWDGENGSKGGGLQCNWEEYDTSQVEAGTVIVFVFVYDTPQVEAGTGLYFCI